LALYTNVPGLAAIAGRDRQLLFHCAEGRAGSAEETQMYVCIDGWMAAGGGLSRDKGRIGRDGIIAVGRIGIGRTYPRRMIVIIISGCRACAQ
jgi:hypothetical protein